MKAERRHELKQNTLVRGLEHVPSAFSVYGPRILLGICVGLLVFTLIRYRMNATVEQANLISNDMAIARTDSELLKSAFSDQDAETLANRRNLLFKEADQRVENVLKNAEAKDSRTRAEALVLRGDLNWTLANLPPVPGSTTQPSLRPEQSNDDLIKTAKEAYEEVLAAHADQTLSAITAHFGLAAIAENAGDWDSARKHYQAVVDNGSAEALFKQSATDAIARLDKISKPILIGHAATLPSTLPTALQDMVPSTLPLAIPTTLPEATATTLPITLPPGPAVSPSAPPSSAVSRPSWH